MLRLLLVILVAAVAATFAMDNMHRVQLGLIVGRPVHVRLFFLLLTSFLVGCFTTVLLSLYLRTQFKKKKETARKTGDDEFFSE